MKLTTLLNPPPLLVEFGPGRLQARRGNEGVDLPLERGPDGRLTPAAREQAIAALKNLVRAKSWQPRSRAWCAITSRGVSLRRLSLPSGASHEFHERLLLQIEAEFPLPPDELAWGCLALDPPRPAHGQPVRQDLLVAAVKKEFLAGYAEILRAAGTEPVFTLASLARWNACGQPSKSFAMLDVASSQAELTIFENAVPAASRTLFWDGKNAAAEPALAALAQGLQGGLPGTKLYVSGGGVTQEFTERLEKALLNACACEWLAAPPAAGSSAAIAGLEKWTGAGSEPTLAIRLEPTRAASATFATLDWKKWGARVGALAAVALLLPYAEALLLKPHLEHKVTAFKTESTRLAVIDRELDFLRYLKLNQPPYLDVLYVFSKSVPPGTHFDSLSLNSHGQVSLHCGFRDGQQVADFRTKLIASGFFTNVVVEEQTPTPDHQRINVRMTAQEQPAAQQQLASAKLAAEVAKDSQPAPPDTVHAGPAGVPGPSGPPGKAGPPGSPGPAVPGGPGKESK